MSIAVARPAGEAVLTNVPAVDCKPPGSKEAAASSRGGRDSGAVKYSFPVTFGDFRNQPLLPGGRGLPNENHVAFQCRLVPSTLGSVRASSLRLKGFLNALKRRQAARTGIRLPNLTQRFLSLGAHPHNASSAPWSQTPSLYQRSISLVEAAMVH